MLPKTFHHHATLGGSRTDTPDVRFLNDRIRTSKEGARQALAALRDSTSRILNPRLLLEYHPVGTLATVAGIAAWGVARTAGKRAGDRNGTAWRRAVRSSRRFLFGAVVSRLLDWANSPNGPVDADDPASMGNA